MPHLPNVVTHNPLSTFAINPVGVSFESEEVGEKIILLLRPHIITLVPPILITISLIILPFLVVPFLNVIGIDLSAFLNGGQIFLILIFWYLFVFGYAFFAFLLWYFNVYILTNERIVDFDFNGILSRQVSFAKLGQIEDVTPKTVGFFGTFFNYGNVYVQTAGTRPEFEFEKVPRPDAVAEEIQEQVRFEEGEPPGVVQ